MTYVPRLKSKYNEEIVTALKDKFQYKSVMQVPRLQKIAINQGVGGASTDKKLIDNEYQGKSCPEKFEYKQNAENLRHIKKDLFKV